MTTELPKYRVYYRRNQTITGWAYPDTLREVKNIAGNRVIRMEIFVRWDHTYPAGYIHTFEAVKATRRIH